MLERLVLVRLQVARAAETGIRVSDDEVEQCRRRRRPAERHRRSSSCASAGGRRRFLHRFPQLDPRRDHRAAPAPELRAEPRPGERGRGRRSHRRAGQQRQPIPPGPHPGRPARRRYRRADRHRRRRRSKASKAWSTGTNSISPPPPCATRTAPTRWKAATWAGAAWTRFRPPSPSMLKTMTPGQVVGPIRGPSGFQLLKLVEVRDGSQAGAETVTEYHARHILVRVTTGAGRRGRQGQDRHAARAHRRRRRFRRGRQGIAPKTPTARAKAAIWAGSRPTRSARAFGKEITGTADGGSFGAVPHRGGLAYQCKRIGERQTDVTSTTQRAQVRETIGRRKLEDEYNRYLQELRGEAYVNVRNGKAPTTKRPPPPPQRRLSRKYPRLALVPGEPAGIGPELCVRLAQQPRSDCRAAGLRRRATPCKPPRDALDLPLRLLEAGDTANASRRSAPAPHSQRGRQSFSAAPIRATPAPSSMR